MKTFIFIILFAVLACISITQVSSDEPPKVGQPQFTLEGAGGGNNAKNWNAGFQAGVGTKVWESKNKQQSVDVGATYSRRFVRHQGHTYKSEPRYGVGLTYKFGRK